MEQTKIIDTLETYQYLLSKTLQSIYPDISTAEFPEELS